MQVIEITCLLHYAVAFIAFIPSFAVSNQCWAILCGGIMFHSPISCLAVPMAKFIKVIYKLMYTASGFR